LRANSVAIIGMAGRFPGADSLEQFWTNLREGVDSITFFSDRELLASGADPGLLARPDFVKAGPVLENIDQFDAGFFKLGRREAELMDPQQRILLELAWETLERAGYAGDAYRGLVGVFAGAGGLMSSYLLSPFHVRRRLLGPTASMQCIGNDKDYLSTRVSYKLNLRGPSITVQTACSTSLVAVHLACQSLLAGECDMALAGGITVRVPQRMGYIRSSQAIMSPDGRCRPFDADAQGTLFGSGAGLVLLKPLAQAVEDGDHVHAVVRGSAVNNDGAAKLSYWAAGADGQTAAVASALSVAEVEPDSIGYMEAHGSATSMGDAVEVFALTKAFRRGGQRKQFCPLGSVKSNIGHLEAAAGVAGLIKAALALERQTVPASLHCERPNPAIDFANSPFYVNTQCQPWPAGPAPRRAAVNSLGIGGTNAHVILEEAPPPPPPSAPGRPAHLLTLSAKTPQAVGELADRYARHLADHPQAGLADVCFTANVGRGHFEHRLALVARSAEEARGRLLAWHAGGSAASCFEGHVKTPGAPVAFLFAGQDALRSGISRELYETLPAFREAMRECEAVVGESSRPSLSSILDGRGDGDSWWKDAQLAQPALFAVEYALAQTWKSWGVEPSALFGYGMGEYVAACLAGVFTLAEGLKLVSARARLVQALPADGRRVALMAGVSRVVAALPSPPADVAVAAVNGPRQVVVSGRAAAVEALVARLQREGVRSRLLDVCQPFYSPQMPAVVDDFRKTCQEMVFRKPRTRLISGLSGQVADDDIATADYWCRHLTEPVQFAAGVATLEEQGCQIFLEVSPRPRLLGRGRRSMQHPPGLWLPTLRPGDCAWQTLLSSLGQLYVHGVKIDWEGFDRGLGRRRVVLPTYPFQRQRYWVTDDAPLHSPPAPGTAPGLPPIEESTIHQLTEELAATGDFSDQELRLLPRILRAMAGLRQVVHR
jgi:acyl transferase domain-containing protein